LVAFPANFQTSMFEKTTLFPKHNIFQIHIASLVIFSELYRIVAISLPQCISFKYYVAFREVSIIKFLKSWKNPAKVGHRNDHLNNLNIRLF
jgi:hypothetical protein